MGASIIDVHTHIFNLKYLPIRGVVESFKVPSVVAIGIEYILLKATDESNLNGFTKGFLKLDNNANDFSRQLDSLVDDEIAEDIAARINEETFLSPEVQDAIIHFENQESYGLDDSTNYLEELSLVKGKESEMALFIFRRLKKLLLGYQKIKHHLKWFRFMMRSEKTIYKNLNKDYGHIKTRVFHMMDPMFFFSGKPTFSIEEKIEKMQYFLKKTNHKMIGFVPYNPRRDNHLEIVRDAIQNKGFSGIKFYPPMGYRPAQNTKLGDDYAPNVKDGALMENRIVKLFEYAVDKRIPVFAHCTPDGFEAVPGESGRNSHPKFWEELLYQHKFSKLKICLGHAGGADGWFARTEEKFDNSFAKGVYELCTTYENVYCEVGFLADIKDASSLPYFRKRLQKLFEKDVEESKYDFKKKIMFGSDWHILFNHGIHKRYDKAFDRLFNADILKDYKEDFFSGNAKQYLNL